MIDWTHPPKRRKKNPQDTNNQLYWQEAFCCCCWVWTGLHANMRWAVIKSIYYFVNCVEPWPVVTYCSNILSFELSLLTRMDFRQLAKVSNSKSFLRLEKASLNQPKHKRTNLAETNEDNKKVEYYSKMTHHMPGTSCCSFGFFYRSSETAGRRHSVPLKRCQVHPGAVNQPVCR